MGKDLTPSQHGGRDILCVGRQLGEARFQATDLLVCLPGWAQLADTHAAAPFRAGSWASRWSRQSLMAPPIGQARPSTRT